MTCVCARTVCMRVHKRGGVAYFVDICDEAPGHLGGVFGVAMEKPAAIHSALNF